MPFYQIEHSIPLTKPEQDELAQAITLIHTRKFTTPSLFVNVQFSDTSNHRNYVAGKECSLNRIIANVRAGGTRTNADFDDLALRVHEAWDRIINPGEKKGEDRKLERVFVMGTITAGVESGFLLPRAGDDADWLKKNLPKFEESASRGDERFVDLVEELKSRADLA